MKKGLLLITILIIITVLFTGCAPKISEDTYSVLNIFTEDRAITYERSENDTVTDVVYNINVEGNVVSTDVIINFAEGQFRSESDFYSDTLMPISATKGNSYSLDPTQNWDIEAIYGDVLSMTAKTPDGMEIRTLDLPERYVDNEALLFTMGTLDYKEGFVKDINVTIIDAGDIITFQVSYLGKETVDVPYGSIECLKVEIKYTGLVLGTKPKMFMWYTNDDQRIPVQYENKGIFLKLKAID